MIFYYAIFSIFCIFAIIAAHNKNSTIKVYFLLMSILFFHDGLRWETGTDWDNYFNAFQRCLSLSIDNFEIGYYSFIQFVRSITEEYTVFLLLHSLIVYALIGFFVWTYSPNPIITIPFLYGFMLPLLGMNRQYMSLAFCLLSINWIVKKKPVLFILTVLFASLFHKSAFMFLPSYFLCRSFSYKFYFIVFLVSLLVGITGVSSFIPSDFAMFLFPEQYQLYAVQTDIGFTSRVLGILRKIVWFVFSIYLLKRTDMPMIFSFAFNMYMIALVVYFLLNGSVFQIIVARGMIYYSFFEIMVLTYIVQYISSKYNRIAYFSMIALYYMFLVYKNIDFYTEDSFNCFIPYKICF